MTEILNAGLRAFVYTVEPKAEGWRLSIDCAELGASLHDAAVREKLRRQWEPHLRACAMR